MDFKIFSNPWRAANKIDKTSPVATKIPAPHCGNILIPRGRVSGQKMMIMYIIPADVAQNILARSGLCSGLMRRAVKPRIINAMNHISPGSISIAIMAAVIPDDDSEIHAVQRVAWKSTSTTL
jgi:hypothetical protein